MMLRIGLVVSGLYYTICGVLLWLAPAFFFTYIGNIGAYNAHYERDCGSFLLPLGVGLLCVSRSAQKHRLFIATAAAGSLLHTFSHLLEGINSVRDVVELIFLFAVAGFLIYALFAEDRTEMLHARG